MKISLLPKTNAGKCSIGAIIIFFILFSIRKLVFILSSAPIGKTFFDPPLIGILMISAWIGGFIALLIGIISIVMKKERSIMVLLSMLFGLLIFLFGLGEIVHPH